MSQRTVYSCDVCHRDLVGQPDLLCTSTAKFVIEPANELDILHLDLELADVCAFCRKRLLWAIENTIQEIRNDEKESQS